MRAITGAVLRVVRSGRGLLPSGQLLPPEVWERRHRGIVWLLWVHVAGLAGFAVPAATGCSTASRRRRWWRRSPCRPPTRRSPGGSGRRRPCSG